jgi:hypothetical protein
LEGFVWKNPSINRMIRSKLLLTHGTNLKWNEFVRYVQWPLLQGTCISIMALYSEWYFLTSITTVSLSRWMVCMELDPGYGNRYSDKATDCTLRDLNLGKDKHFLSLVKRPDWLWISPSLLFPSYRASFQGVKQRSRESYHSPQSTAQVKNGWGCTFNPLYALMAWTWKYTYQPFLNPIQSFVYV